MITTNYRELGECEICHKAREVGGKRQRMTFDGDWTSPFK